ncbi:hypothetical protein [Algoriphagus sp. A40]|uniref:hypothetical protein n=1 Tax=Algoriphagus sp. A40 TaxID=1945863 RepID=UPI0009869B31|nr:hypothetical protein [Algoriphagus sp. A40]OOG69421.1 hypothetical protein B0E43_20720 [Algoriphagus sp. A40]
METIDLIIEKAEKKLWGRVEYRDNLITEVAESVNELEEKIKALLWDFENLDPASVQFNHLYDMYSLFQQFDYLNISKVAIQAGMNPSLLRQYSSGVKSPSAEQAKKIEDTLHRLAKELKGVSVFVGE